MSEWIEWKGGECPVDLDVLVAVEFGDNKVYSDERAGYWVWDYFGDKLRSKIIRYKIIDIKKELEQNSSESNAIVSDGGSSSYYTITIKNKAGESFECVTGDIIKALVGNDFDLGNIVKACRRAYEASQGRGKDGVTVEYDMNKVKYFADEFARWNSEKHY